MMLKKIGYSLLILLALFIITAFFGIRYFNNMWFGDKPHHLTYTFEEEPIDFQWAQQTYEDYVEPRAAMIIPIRLAGIPNKFYIQFDTGAPTSTFYEKGLNTLDSLGYTIPINIIDEAQYISSFSFELGENQIKTANIKIYEDYGWAFSPEDTFGYNKLGTIGADFLVNRITAIDFKNQKIRFYKKRPSWMSALDFQQFDFAGRRFMLPVHVAGRDETLFYDSGCSAFGLITSKDRYDRYTDENISEIHYDGNSWGSSMSIHHKVSDMAMEIGQKQYPLGKVSYIDMYATLQKYLSPFTSIGGWLGNEPFIDQILIFDTTSDSEFALMKSDDGDLVTIE